MLGIYEKRHFGSGEKLWFGRYRNLTNVLHWHLECELIRIGEGRAELKIGDVCFSAEQGDCFFCDSEALHYIVSEPGAQVDVLILDESLTKDMTDRYTVRSPKLSADIPVKAYFDRIRRELSQKAPFYRESLETAARGLLIEIFRNDHIPRHDDNARFHQKLIAKINDEFAFITFADAVRYAGYSAAHFSKLFKTLSGISFSEYLNIIRVENAIMLLRSGENQTVTSVSLQCGFSTVRNFNRVFKKITGYSPRALPADFVIDTGLRISKTERFDPTGKNSILI